MSNNVLGIVLWGLAIFGIAAMFLLSIGFFDEPVTHSCNINGQSFPFEYGTCKKVCNAIEGRFYVSVMMGPKFVNGCEVNK